MQDNIFLEETLNEEWERDRNLTEVEISNKPFFYLKILILILGLIVVGRIMLLNLVLGQELTEQAEINSGKKEYIVPPRGIIYDRFGKELAQNKLSFKALLDIKELINNKDKIDDVLNSIEQILNIPKHDLIKLIEEKIGSNTISPIVLSYDLSQNQLIELKTKSIPAIKIAEGYFRYYPEGKIFSSILGYVGLPSKEDLMKKPYLNNQTFTGKTGIEYQYDKNLIGSVGIILNKQNALGEIISSIKIQEPKPGENIYLTIDAEFQKYIFEKTKKSLESLGRNSGGVIALNPQTGEVLSLISFPTYDNNIFIDPTKRKEVLDLLNNKSLPLFNRIISGEYAPGSTIKPMVGIAALKEGIIDPYKSIFSPGYLDVPNPYNPGASTRFLDWKPNGWVNLYSAIAQSSNVYFYTIGGGFGDISGLGINKLIEWWKIFKLGEKTKIDLPGEKEGFLPTPDWHQKILKRPWLLGDTYNVSIGQGDLKVTPIQLINYISAIANGGKIYKPFLLKENKPEILADISYLIQEIKEVKKGMVQTVESPLGTAHILADLPFSVAAKTGTAQIEGNKAENAFFVGFAPSENPQIALLVLVENARQGSLNAVPIAKDILRWFYENRIKTTKN